MPQRTIYDWWTSDKDWNLREMKILPVKISTNGDRWWYKKFLRVIHFRCRYLIFFGTRMRLESNLRLNFDRNLWFFPRLKKLKAQHSHLHCTHYSRINKWTSSESGRDWVHAQTDAGFIITMTTQCAYGWKDETYDCLESVFLLVFEVYESSL